MVVAGLDGVSGFGKFAGEVLDTVHEESLGFDTWLCSWGSGET